jgi:hypothetical protein
MMVRKLIGEFGTLHCRLHSEKSWRSHYVSGFPEHIVGRYVSGSGPKVVASEVVTTISVSGIEAQLLDIMNR